MSGKMIILVVFLTFAIGSFCVTALVDKLTTDGGYQERRDDLGASNVPVSGIASHRGV